MITLITAVPGSGKTLYAIGLIKKALGEGRAVYTNIEGLVREKFDPQYLLFDAPDDWRSTPDGSLVIYDEAQQPHLYPSTAKPGAVTDARLTAMETHRHTGHDLVFITQAPTFVHHHIRKLCGEHVHLYRSGGVQTAAKYTWAHICDSPNDRAEQQRADFSLFKFPREHFDHYKSATVHTHKLKIPVRLAVLAVAVVAIFGGVAWHFLTADSVLLQSSPSPAPAAAPPADASPAVPAAAPAFVGAPSWTDTPAAPASMGCISSSSRPLCQCYDMDGKPFRLTYTECRAAIERPLPILLSRK